MVQCYTNPEAIIYIGTSKLKVEKLAIIVDAIFDGLGSKASATSTKEPNIKIVS